MDEDVVGHQGRGGDLLIRAGRLAGHQAPIGPVSILILNGRFRSIVPASEESAVRPPGVPVLDLSDLLVMPGLIDAHNHQQSAARDRLTVAVAHVDSIPTLVAELEKAARTRSAGSWIVSERSLTRAQLQEHRFPTARELDARIADHPVAVRFGAHAMALNTAALAASGLLQLESDPVGGVLERDDDGGLLGPIHEYGAIRSVERCLLTPSDQDHVQALEATITDYLSVGLTGVRVPGMRPGELAWYQALEERSDLRMRVAACVRTDTNAPFGEKVAAYRSWQVRTGFGSDRLWLDAIKIFVDGGVQPFGSPTTVFVDPDELERLVLEASGRSWAVTCHAVSQEAVSAALSAYAAVRASGLHTIRLAIEHAFWASVEQVERARDLGVWLSVQPNLDAINAHHLTSGNGRTARSIDIRNAFETGARVALGSDWNATPGTRERPYSPLRSIATVVESGLDPATALDLHTRQVGLLMGRDDVGALRKGHHADLVAYPDVTDLEGLLADPGVAPATVIVGGDVVLGERRPHGT